MQQADETSGLPATHSATRPICVQLAGQRGQSSFTKMPNLPQKRGASPFPWPDGRLMGRCYSCIHCIANFTLPLGGSNARNERSGRADGSSIVILTRPPRKPLTLVSDPPRGRVKFPWPWLRLLVVLMSPSFAPRNNHCDCPNIPSFDRAPDAHMLPDPISPCFGPSAGSWDGVSNGGLMRRVRRPFDRRSHVLNFSLPPGRVEGEERACGEGGWRLDRCSNGPPRKFAYAHCRPSRRREGEVSLASFTALGSTNVAMRKGPLIGQPRRSIQTYLHVLNFTLPPGRVEGEERAFGEGGWRLDRCSNGPPRKFAYAHCRPSRRREGEVSLASFTALGSTNVAMRKGPLIGQPRRSIQTYLHVLNFTLPPGRVEGEERAFGEGGWRLDRCSNGPPRKFAYAHCRPSRRREGEVSLASFTALGSTNVAMRKGPLIGQPRRSIQTYLHVLNFTLPPGRVEGEVRACGEGGWRLDRCSNGPPRKLAYGRFRPSQGEGEVVA